MAKQTFGQFRSTMILTWSSIKMFVRNRQALFFTFFMPVIIMTVFGLVGFDKVPKIPVGIVTNANSPAIQNFIDQMKNISAFDVKTGSETDERAAIEKGERAIVIIPIGWMEDRNDRPPIRPGEKVSMSILSNAGSQQTPTALSIINQYLDKATIAITLTPIIFDLNIEEINSRNLKYIDFLVPGIIALAIMQMAVFSVAFIFTDYKEKGILKRLIATPMRPYQFVAANIVTRMIVAIIQSATLIAIGILVFKAHMFGSYSLLLLVIFLGAVMFLGLGFTISGIASTVESVPAIANLIVFPMLFLGGTFFPISTMPDWLQHIVKYLPLTYLSNSLREIMTKDASFSMIQSDVIWMVVWSIVLIILANFTFGFEEKRV